MAMLYAAFSQAAPPPNPTANTVLSAHRADRAYRAYTPKEDDCIKKWISAGPAATEDANPYLQTPTIVDRKATTMWINPLGEQCQFGQDKKYIYDGSRQGGGAVAVNCVDQPANGAMYYSPEIQKYKYYTYSTQWDPSGSLGKAVLSQECERRSSANSQTMTCDDTTGFCCTAGTNAWSVFPSYTNTWTFAYFEEKKATTSRMTVLGKDCNCAKDNQTRSSFGAKIASVSIWKDGLSNTDVETLANGKLPKVAPIVSYIGDHAHDRDHSHSEVMPGRLWMAAGLQGGADMTIFESPETESFSKGSLHYETNLPACIKYGKSAGAPSVAMP